MSETPTSPAAAPSSSSRLLPSEPHSPRVPAKVSTDGLETAWGERWESEGTYAFDRSGLTDITVFCGSCVASSAAS